MDETEYLLSSKANKKHLLKAIKSKKFTRFTSEEFDEYSKQLIKSTMKDKFEEAIIKECCVVEAPDGSFLVGFTKNAANACNTLHQQAMKEKLKEQRLNCHADLRRHFMKHGIKFTSATLKGILDSIKNATEPE